VLLACFICVVATPFGVLLIRCTTRFGLVFHNRHLFCFIRLKKKCGCFASIASLLSGASCRTLCTVHFIPFYTNTCQQTRSLKRNEYLLFTKTTTCTSWFLPSSAKADQLSAHGWCGLSVSVYGPIVASFGALIDSPIYLLKEKEEMSLLYILAVSIASRVMDVTVCVTTKSTKRVIYVCTTTPYIYACLHLLNVLLPIMNGVTQLK